MIEGVSLPSGDAGKLRTVPDPVVAGLRPSLYPMVGSYLARRGKKRYCDPVDEKWGTGSRPADLRVPASRRPAAATARVQAGSATARVQAGHGAADASSGTGLVSERVQAGLQRLDAQFARSWGHCSAESVLLFATLPGQGGDAWWRLELDAGTVTAGAGDCAMDTDWTVTGSAQAWRQVLSGGINLGVAFRRGELRYADKGDGGAGSPVADNRVAMLAELLGVIRWQPADADGQDAADRAQPQPCG